MPLDYSRLRNLTARELIRALGKDGFTLDRQTGSHQLYYHLPVPIQLKTQ
jgi:predicted RNA binding protein YcfA (HicA-like mRNA interferase family)